MCFHTQSQQRGAPGRVPLHEGRVAIFVQRHSQKSWPLLAPPLRGDDQPCSTHSAGCLVLSAAPNITRSSPSTHQQHRTSLALQCNGVYKNLLTKILSGYFFAETSTSGGYPTLVYSILLNIATKLELRKATHAAKLELLEATLVALESYKRRTAVRFPQDSTGVTFFPKRKKAIPQWKSMKSARALQLAI